MSSPKHVSSRTRLRTPCWTLLGTLLAVCAAATVSHVASAVGTREFVLDSLETFDDGDLAGVAVSSDGTVRAGWTLANTAIPDASSVWSSLVLDDGTVLLGTGSGGRIYQIKNGKVSLAAETGAMAVSALAVAFDGDVVAGTFPDGKLYKVAPQKLDGSKLAAWVELKDTEDVWGLGFDAKNKALYAATGPEGKLYRVDAAGKSQVYFDSEEAHLVSVAVADGGEVYTGSNGKGLLYKLTGPGRATVLHDFDADDVKAIAVVSTASKQHAGAVYAVANSYRGAYTGLPRRVRPGSQATPTSNSPPRAGQGKLYRFSAAGVAEELFDSKQAHLVSLALDAEGMAYVGTGADGRVYTVDDAHVTRLLADTEERQVGALAVVGKTPFIATTDPVVFHPITGSGGVDAVWTSKVLDAGLRAHFGMLRWTSDGALELQTRSGNTGKPDGTWGGWSKALAKPGKVTSPAARYLQIRARWARDPKAVLSDVKVAFVTDNARAIITEITVGDSRSSTGASSVPKSGGPPDSPSSKLQIGYKVDNPDNDQVRYRLFYQRAGAKQWFAILDSDVEHTSTSYSWDTAGLPEGSYRVRVDASDELSNPPDKVTRHTGTSRTFTVDNTPPRFTKLTLRGDRLSGTAVDGVGPIARFEFGLAGSKTFYPVFPADDVFDEATESFDLDVSRNVPAGSVMVVVRAYDTNGNMVSQAVTR